MEWGELRSLWDSIERRNTPNWDVGKAFEYLVIRAFELDGAEVRYPYNVRLFEEEIEQIDGAIHISGLSCLVESKDFADKKVDIAPVAKLRINFYAVPPLQLAQCLVELGLQIQPVLFHVFCRHKQSYYGMAMR
jgi:hypothetical protein